MRIPTRSGRTRPRNGRPLATSSGTSGAIATRPSPYGLSSRIATNESPIQAARTRAALRRRRPFDTRAAVLEDAEALDRPEGADVESKRPTANLIVFSGTRARGLCSATRQTDARSRHRLTRRRSRSASSARRPKVMTMKIDLEPLEEDALEADDEAGPVEAGLDVAAARRAASVFAERLLLVVHRLEARRRKDRLRNHCRPKTSSRLPTTSAGATLRNQLIRA